MAHLWLEETYINATRGHGIGESGIYESDTDNVGELYRALRKEYGRCVSAVYVDPAEGGPPKRIGWVFQKRDRYEDTREPYIREVWVTLHDAPPTVTREFHHHVLDGQP